ncbi:carotene biosynthesis protein [Belliella sp. R4-6]|uniref:Carotene biosynthesis protein n=1 Tax=Belliella alkalica TaxID=1730871 RepID=A0ABS9VAW1_9BACT|nr:carotene biosynthesis protein [Belliella alkalica]MCH7413570.1 carotene biosynthesis protein [Belliella alkalica]
MKNRIQFYSVILIYAIALFIMGYCIDRSDFFVQFALYVLCFWASLIIYFYSVKWEVSLKMGLISALLLRMILIISEPVLSDDFFRFVFDGQLIRNGINPYLYLPDDSLSLLSNEVSVYWQTLLDGMNSQEYYSVYPPFHQLFFYIAALGGENLLANIVILRLLILVFEGFTFYLLYSLLSLLGLKISQLWLYAFNPLVILELTGNLHFEGIVLTGLLAALYFYHKNQTKSSGISWAWAVGVKLSPLMILPLWIRAWKGKSLIWFLGVSMVVVGASLMPLVFGTGYLNFWKSFRLYQSSFEFNASIYYILRWISGFWLDYNPIQTLGPVLNLLAFITIIILVFKWKIQKTAELAEGIVWIFLVYLLFQTTVHPWYLIPAFGLSLLTKNKVLLAWSGTVFLSYAAYSNDLVEENAILLFIQYGIVFGMIIWTFLKRFTVD